MAPAEKRFALISKRSTKTEPNCGMTRAHCNQLAVSLRQTCTRDSSPTSLPDRPCGGRSGPVVSKRKHGSNRPFTNLGHKVEIQSLYSIRGSVIVRITEERRVGNHQRRIARVPKR